MNNKLKGVFPFALAVTMVILGFLLAIIVIKFPNNPILSATPIEAIKGPNHQYFIEAVGSRGIDVWVDNPQKVATEIEQKIDGVYIRLVFPERSLIQIDTDPRYNNVEIMRNIETLLKEKASER